MTNFANTAIATLAALLLSATCIVAAVGPAQAAPAHTVSAPR